MRPDACPTSLPCAEMFDGKVSSNPSTFLDRERFCMVQVLRLFVATKNGWTMGSAL